MTQKDYRLLASVVDFTRLAYHSEPGSKAVLRVLVSNMCRELKKENPRFKEEVFVKACGF